MDRIIALESEVAKINYRLSWFEASQTTCNTNLTNQEGEASALVGKFALDGALLPT